MNPTFATKDPHFYQQFYAENEELYPAPVLNADIVTQDIDYIEFEEVHDQEGHQDQTLSPDFDEISFNLFIAAIWTARRIVEFILTCFFLIIQTTILLLVQAITTSLRTKRTKFPDKADKTSDIYIENNVHSNGQPVTIINNIYK